MSENYSSNSLIEKSENDNSNSVDFIQWGSDFFNLNSSSNENSGINRKGDRDPAEIERSNLVNICKLVVKELLEQSLRFGRMLDSDHLPLQHFFIVLEHVLRHGLRPKKGLLGPKKELWDLLQNVEKYCIEAQDITASVRDLPTVRTHIGRARAWLRIALMQKKLADYLQSLVEHKEEILIEYYEPHALMMSDEVVVIIGILVGLNVIDFNLCVKEEDLDSQQGVIDFSLYLRTSSRNSPEDEGNMIEAPEGNMTTVLDQKNYIEELNRHLNATVTNLQTKVESLTTTNALMKEDLAIARNSLLTLQAENQALRQSLQNKLSNYNHLQTAQVNLEHVETQSKSSDTSIELNEALAEEKRKNQELEKELRLQTSIKAETDMAMKLLEKDIHEKQDTIISLRRQLEDIKQINLEMYKKLQECESSLRHKTELLSKLELQKEDMANAITQLEKKWNLDKANLTSLQDSTKELSLQLNMNEQRAARAETDVRIEREWRLSLQDKEVKLKSQINQLQSRIEQLTKECDQSKKLKIKLEQVERQWAEAQTTLEEMGIQLSVSKLKVSELREKIIEQEKYSTLRNNELMNTKASDSTVIKCKGCNREFNVTRRKHHCRNCGLIFCNNCSERMISLPDEHGKLGKPVRVCDNCYRIVEATRK